MQISKPLRKASWSNEAWSCFGFFFSFPYMAFILNKTLTRENFPPEQSNITCEDHVIQLCIKYYQQVTFQELNLSQPPYNNIHSHHKSYLPKDPNWRHNIKILNTKTFLVSFPNDGQYKLIIHMMWQKKSWIILPTWKKSK